MWRVIMTGWMICACAGFWSACGTEARAGGDRKAAADAGGPPEPAPEGPPVTVLFLPGLGAGHPGVEGLGPAGTFAVYEASPAAAFVQLAAGTTDHLLFAERMIVQGREVPVSSAAPGVALPVTGTSTQVWAPRLGRVTDAEPGRMQYRPSRNPRARMEVVPCPGEIAWTDRAGDRIRVVRVRGCPGPVQLEFPTQVGVPGPAGRIGPATGSGLQVGEVGTWIWSEEGRLWAVSLGILRIGDGKVVWHREGPVADAVFGPADWIALRDGELDIHMQAGFIRGALRAQMAAIANRPAQWTIAELHPLADLQLALAQAPGSWEKELLDAAVVEVMDFVRDRLAAGHRVALAGVGPMVPVTRLVSPEVFAGPGAGADAGADAAAVVPGTSSVLFLYDDPGPERRRRLESGLARMDLTAARDCHLYRVPGGYRLDLPPGMAVGRCRNKKNTCDPPDSRGQWVSAPWLTGWLRIPADTAEPPARFLAGLLRHLRASVRVSKSLDSFNE